MTLQKPGCHADVLSYLRDAPDTGVTHPSQVAIVGDRLFTDVMMANMMGSYGFWIRDGVVEEKGLVSRFMRIRDNITDNVQFVKLERSLEGFLNRRGYVPPSPQNQFE
jgi:phosphatidylglycerophosphatase GEP4